LPAPHAPRRARSSALPLVALLLALAVVAAACGTGSTNASDGTTRLNEENTPLEPEGNAQRGGKLVVALPAETNGWNPHVNQWADAGSLAGGTFLEPLFILDADGVPEPWLAETATPNADFTEWDITVKPGIEFHNGEKLDSNALKLNIESSYTSGLTSMALKSMIDHVEPTGDLSVKVFLQKPWAQYPVTLAGSAKMMAPEMMAMEDKGVLAPIGTGPFKFDEWVQNESLKVVKFDKYWRKDTNGETLPYLDEIEFRPITDDDTKQQALQSGDVDFALTTSAFLAENLEGEFNVLKDYTSERTFVMLNTVDGQEGKTNPFTNVHARKAIAYATNREEIAGLVGVGIQTTSNAYRPDSQWGIPEDQSRYYNFDIEQAKQEVERYKQDTGAESLSFTLSGLTSVEDARLMQALQQQWKEAGIEASIESIEQVKYISTLIISNYQAAWMRYYGSPSPDSNYSLHHSDNALGPGQLNINFTGYTSEQLDSNLEAARKTGDFAEQKKYNDAIVKELNEQAVNIWMFDTPYAIITTQQVKGLNHFRTHPFGNFTSKPWWGEVWLDPNAG
jgi:peptide/nickel transport system substrate-binding protein